MLKRILLIVAAWAATVSLVHAGAAGTATNGAEHCQALAHTDFSGIQDAPTTVMEATLVNSNADAPAFCEIRGYVAPNVGFELRLPAKDWNGKFFEVGCGGDCGTTSQIAECPLHKGYACIASDMGHQGGNGLWAWGNLQAQIDYAYRGPHVAAVAGKAISASFYGSVPSHSYFHGCSSGGRQAMIEAQRFPWDFDGIIAGAPWIDDSDATMSLVWANRALKGEDGKPILTRRQLRRIHEAVLEKCDMDDGVRDGIVGDPPACKFDPGELECRSGEKSDCLSAAQVEAVRKVYTGPQTSLGEKTFTGGEMPGSELWWIRYPDQDVPNCCVNVLNSDQSVSSFEEWATEYFQWMVIPASGPTWKLSDFDFDRDYKRFASGAQESLLNAGNPDLRKFRRAGGHLMIYVGWNDEMIPGRVADYYDTVERVVGGRAATQEFFRTFIVPGMVHCGGGDGPDVIDYLSALEDWVERNEAPDRLIGSHLKPAAVSEDRMQIRFPLNPSTVSFTRPIYPYPVVAKYRGTGDPNDAVNFAPVDPESVARNSLSSRNNSSH